MSHKRKPILIFAVLIGAIGLFSLYFIFFGNRPGPRVDFRSAVGVAAQDFELPALGVTTSSCLITGGRWSF